MIEATTASLKKEDGSSSAEAADSPGSTDKGKRLLMKDWLQSLLDTNKMPDILQWVNKNDGLFKIRWLHKATDKWSLSSDAILFKEWCMHTGKFDPKQENPRRWKANFRCALNSLPDVVIVKDLCVKRGKDAYRVYKILPEKLPEKVREKQEQARKRRRLDLPKRQSGSHAVGRESVDGGDRSFVSATVGSSDGDYMSTSSDSSGDDTAARTAAVVAAAQKQFKDYQLQDGLNGINALCTAAFLMGDMTSGNAETTNLPPATAVVRQVTASSLHNDIVTYYHPVVAEKPLQPVPLTSALSAKQPRKGRRWPASATPSAAAAAAAAATAVAAATAAHKASLGGGSGGLFADGTGTAGQQRSATGVLSMLPPASQHPTSSADASSSVPIREIVLTIDTNPLSLPPGGTIIPVASLCTAAATSSSLSACVASVIGAAVPRQQQLLLPPPVRLLSSQQHLLPPVRLLSSQQRAVHVLPSVHAAASGLHIAHLAKRVGNTVHVQLTSASAVQPPAVAIAQQQQATVQAAAAAAAAVSAAVATAASATAVLSPGSSVVRAAGGQRPALHRGNLDITSSSPKMAQASMADQLPRAVSVATAAAIQAAVASTLKLPASGDVAPVAQAAAPPVLQALVAQVPEPPLLLVKLEAIDDRTSFDTAASSPAASASFQAHSESAVSASCASSGHDVLAALSCVGIDSAVASAADVRPPEPLQDTLVGGTPKSQAAAAAESPEPVRPPSDAAAAAAEYARLKQAVCDADFSSLGFVTMPTAATIRVVRLRDLEFPSVDVCVTVDERFLVTVAAAGKPVGRDHELWMGLPKVLTCTADLEVLLRRLGEFSSCRGLDAGLLTVSSSAAVLVASSSSVPRCSDDCAVLVHRADCCPACRLRQAVQS